MTQTNEKVAVKAEDADERSKVTVPQKKPATEVLPDIKPIKRDETENVQQVEYYPLLTTRHFRC